MESIGCRDTTGETGSGVEKFGCISPSTAKQAAAIPSFFLVPLSFICCYGSKARECLATASVMIC